MMKIQLLLLFIFLSGVAEASLRPRHHKLFPPVEAVVPDVNTAVSMVSHATVSETADTGSIDRAWAAAEAAGPAPASAPGPAPAAEGSLWAADSHQEEFSNEYQPFTRRKHLHEPSVYNDKRWMFEMREGPGDFDLDGDYVKDSRHDLTPAQRAAKEEAYQRWLHPDRLQGQEYEWHPERAKPCPPKASGGQASSQDAEPCPQGPQAPILPDRKSSAMRQAVLVWPLLWFIALAFMHC